jgi:catechol 2,3-dioxygenase-like lactoylglutathione lyase family enzyme
MAKAQETGNSMMASDDLDAVEFGQSLRGLGFNLLVTDVDATIEFSKKILLANVLNNSEGFAILKRSGAIWMLHADITYHSNPLVGFVRDVEGRGQGIELRLYDLDPDEAEARANENGYVVLAGSANKPHGLRECYILDPDGYCWVPSRSLREGEE